MSERDPMKLNRRAFFSTIAAPAISTPAAKPDPLRAKQKFLRGDIVRLSRDHAWQSKGTEAIVEYSYADRYGGSMDHHRKEYSLLITSGPNRGGMAWFSDDEIEMISPRSMDTLNRLDAHT